MKILMTSLGCDKNLVDSEMMMGILSEEGFELTNDEQEAEIVIVNTCSFILDAKQESIDTLIEFGELKKNGNLKILVCAGCLAERYSDEIKAELPEVDIIVGTTAFDKIAEAINAYIADNSKCDYIEDINRLVYGKKRIISTGGYYAHLKIAEGCDKRCTYCAIPYFRGAYRSVPMEVLIDEAKTLASQGVKELILVAQETTVYGKDLYGEKRLHILLKELAKIEDISWIRVQYCYPEEIYDELIETFASEPKICKYLDMPIQHADDYILRRMGRRTDNKYLREIIGKLRSAIPDIALRTTLITGFPGETDEMFENMMDFIEEMRFDRLGVFAYSAEEDTPAYSFENQVEDEIKEQRRQQCMELQQEIAFEKAEEKIGNVYDVLIDGRVDGGALVGRTFMDAPEVDGYVFIESERDIESGKIMKVRITDSNEYDLIGEFEDESAE